MRARVVVVTGVAAAVAIGGVANAAPHKKAKPKPVPPVCNIVTDQAGDSNVDLTLGLAPGEMPADPNGDILSADLASDGKFVTAVIRVKSLAAPDTAFPEAHLYMVSWTAPGHSTPVYLAATIDPNPASAAYGPQFVFGDGSAVSAPALGPVVNYYNIASAPVKGTVDTAKNTITLSVPVSAISSYGKFTPSNHFSAVQVQTQAVANGPVLPTNVPSVGGSIGWGWQEDVADGTKDYVAGTPSCVKPGS